MKQYTAIASGLLLPLLLSDARAETSWSDFKTTDSTVTMENNVTATGKITLSKDLIIDGQSKYTLKGDSSRGFDVKNGASLTLKNLTVSDFNVADDGAFIYLYKGSVAIDSSTFTNNKAQDTGAGSVLFSQTNAGLYLPYIKNSVFSQNSSNYDGGAISFSGNLGLIYNTNFEGNTAKYSGGAMWVSNDNAQKSGSATTPLFIQKTTFRNNSLTAEKSCGGALYLEEIYNDIYIGDSSFEGNTAVTGGAIYLYDSGYDDLNIINTSFTGNTAVTGGAIFKDGLYNDLNIIDTSFTENTATGDGGAIYALETSLSIVAQNEDVVFSGNTAGAMTESYNAGGAVYFDTSSSDNVLGLNASEGRKVVFNDSIAGWHDENNDLNLEINAPKTYSVSNGTSSEDPSYASLLAGIQEYDAGTTGEIQFNARVGDDDYPFNIKLYEGVLSLGQNETNNASVENADGWIDGNNLMVLGASTLNTVNNRIGSVNLGTLTLKNQLNYAVDVDLANSLMDRVTAKTVEVSDGGKVNVSAMNVISDGTNSKIIVPFAEDNLKAHVTSDVTEAYDTIYKYTVRYNNEDGTFIFERPITVSVSDTLSDEVAVEDSSSPMDYNPYVYEERVMAGYIDNLQKTINTFLFHDYALGDSAFVKSGIASGDASNRNVWAKMLYFDDKSKYDDFYDVESKTSILLGGVSSEPQEILTASMVLRFYGGAIYGESEYANVSTKDKGGLLGVSADFKENGWRYGANVTGAFLRTNSDTVYGTDHYTSRWVGMTAKSGYQFDLNDYWAIRPSVHLGYTIADTDTIWSKSGERIRTKSSMFWDLVPNMKVTRKLGHDTEVFGSARYVITTHDGGTTYVNQSALPFTSEGNYGEYGIGFEKFGNEWTIDLGIFRRDGNRKGWNGYLSFAYPF